MTGPALSYRQVGFSYAGAARPVFEHLDWDIPEGSFALLVGATGSGKSTLLSLAKREIAPAGEMTGEIRVFGEPVLALDASSSAQTVGYVFQNPENQVVCESVWHEMAFGLENLGTPQGEMRRRVAETSYFFGIDDWFRADTATLSGGKKQLLALASTLVLRPRLLLLDEPTAQLDPIAERTFLHALFRVNRELGCTVVVATHRPRAMVDYATCAWRLEDGAIREVPDISELAGRPSLLGDGTPAGAPERGGAKDGRPRVGEELPGAAPSSPGAASLSRAWFRYARDCEWVLRGLDLDIARGEIHALVGGNGCGKTTLLALMARTLRLQQGSLKVAEDARALLPQDPRALFVAESAEDELVEWSVPGGYDRAAADAMLERMGLSDVAATHPYDLSGGQQQLLALGKLLLLRPCLLLLDEPTKGLDLASRRKVARVLLEQRDAGATVVMATHDLDFVEQVADRVSMVFDGEVACTDSTREFFSGNVYYRP